MYNFIFFNWLLLSWRSREAALWLPHPFGSSLICHQEKPSSAPLAAALPSRMSNTLFSNWSVHHCLRLESSNSHPVGMSWRPLLDQASRTTSSTNSRDMILRPPHWKGFHCFMDTLSRHSQEILSIRAMNRICDKKKVWQSSTPSVNKSDLIPTMETSLVQWLNGPYGPDIHSHRAPRGRIHQAFSKSTKNMPLQVSWRGCRAGPVSQARKQKAHCCN